MSRIREADRSDAPAGRHQTRCAAWAYRFVAVWFGVFAAGIYVCERISGWGPNHSNPPPPVDPNGETIAGLFVLVVVPVVLLTLREIGARPGPNRRARWACGAFVWGSVGAFLAFGLWRGAGIVSGLDAVLTVGSAVVVTAVLVSGARKDEPT